MSRARIAYASAFVLFAVCAMAQQSNDANVQAAIDRDNLRYEEGMRRASQRPSSPSNSSNPVSSEPEYVLCWNGLRVRSDLCPPYVTLEEEEAARREAIRREVEGATLRQAAEEAERQAAEQAQRQAAEAQREADERANREALERGQRESAERARTEQARREPLRVDWQRGELPVITRLPLRTNGEVKDVYVHGPTRDNIQVTGMNIVVGRMFVPGAQELIVGKDIADRFGGADLGTLITIGGREWLIVGVFSASYAGTTMSDQIWGDRETLIRAYGNR